MIFGIGAVLAKCEEILVALANINSRIGAFRMATQQDVENLAQQIQQQTATWQAWASDIQTKFNNVVTALQAAQQANNVDLTDAINAATAGQDAANALPVETDPTAPVVDPNAGS